MRNPILFTLILFICLPLLKAQVENEIVSLGPGYQDHVWYNLETGATTSFVQSDWDLAFEITGFSAAILVNTAVGNEAWVYPKGDTASWESVDTIGLASWIPAYNSDTTWGLGALNAGFRPENEFDLGWGIYNFSTHHVTGDSIFVIKLANGDFQKLWIQSLASGVYSFRHAGLNDSLDMEHSIDKQNFGGKRFAYFNLRNHSTYNPEPPADEWDLLFTRYTSFLTGAGPDPIPYTVSGVLSDADLTVAEAYPVADPATFTDYEDLTFSTQINTIGYDWKSFEFSTNTWSLNDSLVYFVKTGDEKVWKLVFDDFGGSATGEFIFRKEEMNLATSLAGNLSGAKKINVYPNPVRQGEGLFLSLELEQSQELTISLKNIQGQQLLLESFFASIGIQNKHLSLSGIASGVYILSINNTESVINKKFIIK